jgi:23S rRNA (uracil1939-C5)-methyltransferase
LARDIAVLKSDYRVAEVQPVDMFPHTWHIESVARLERC